MDLEAKRSLLLSCLERAAQLLGDITPHVMQRYYDRFPDAKVLFEQLHPGGRTTLEGQMVEQVVYCLMEWFDCPGEVEIVLISTIPHHLDTLGIRPELFFDLIGTVFDTIDASIPTSLHEERAVLAELRRSIGGLVAAELDFARRARQRCGEARSTHCQT